MPIEDGVNLLGCRHVRGGDGVIAKLRDSQRPGRFFVADPDGEDIVTRVGLFCRGYRAEIASEALSVEAALKDLRVANRAVRSVGIVHPMQCKGGGVEVAFGHDACGVDELLVFGTAIYWRAIEVGRGAQ